MSGLTKKLRSSQIDFPELVPVQPREPSRAHATVLLAVLCAMSSVCVNVQAGYMSFDEATYLALETSGTLVAPAGLTDQIDADLALIRETFPEIAGIHDRPSWAPGAIVRLSDEAYQAHLAGTFDDLDSLLRAFGGAVEHTFHHFPYLAISFAPIYHSERLAEVFAAVKGVAGASADIMLGDGDDIEISGGGTRSRGAGETALEAVFTRNKVHLS